MAVKVQNTKNIRKARRWDEKDDSALLELLRKKIKEVTLAIRDAPSPFMRARLKAKRKHYKDMATKVADGTYNGDIIFSEMQAAAALRTQEAINRERFLTPSEAKKYISSYEDMDFDYERYFRKTRYYGRSLPILMTIITIILLAYFLVGALLPASVKTQLNDYSLKPDAVFSFKLGENELDFKVKNDGNWPSGDWRIVNGVEQRLAYGERYVDPNTEQEPEYVFLYKDLGMLIIDISAFDIIKAWFFTKMLQKVRLDFIEDLPFFKGASRWFNIKYMEKAEANIVNLRNEDDSFNTVILVKYISGYCIILLLVVSFILTIVCLFLSIGRIFSFTTRKFHSLHIMLFIFGLLIALLPALMAIEASNEIIPAFKNYLIYMSDISAFKKAETATMTISLFAFVPVITSFLLLLLPKIFKNRLKKRPTFIPKGNRPRRQTGEIIEQIAYDNVEKAYQNSDKR